MSNPLLPEVLDYIVHLLHDKLETLKGSRNRGFQAPESTFLPRLYPFPEKTSTSG